MERQANRHLRNNLQSVFANDFRSVKAHIAFYVYVLSQAEKPLLAMLFFQAGGKLMANIHIMSTQETDERGHPTLQLMVQGHMVEAVFVAEEDNATLIQMKSILMDSYVHHFASTIPECQPNTF